MFEVLTAEQSRDADRHAMEGGIPGIQLMKAAGAAVAHQIMQHVEKTPVLVLCGKGKNGGDGFVVAKILQENGWDVRVSCIVKTNQLSGDSKLVSQEWGGDVEPLNSNLSPKDAGLVVDAVYGTGFSGQIDPEIITLFDKIRAKNLPVVAIDLPSGVNASDDRVAEGSLKAHMTVTFVRKKLAHTLYPAKAHCGNVHLSQIGVSDESITLTGCSAFENNPALWLKSYPLPTAQMHKYNRGHVAVFGGERRTGAACLAAQAAQRLGAGAVTLIAPEKAAAVYQNHRSSIMVDPWKTLEEIKVSLRDERKNVLVIGPGLGRDQAEVVETALSFGRPAVLDADIFSIYENAPKTLFPHLTPEKHILTPHEGEFQRLFPDIASGHKVERALKAAKTANAVILLKGADTVIAAPDGACIINTKAPATLATAGSGDVLSGMIAGLVAQGMAPFMAAAAASFLHAESARRFGLGLTPEDLLTELPATLNSLFYLKTAS